MGRLAGLGVCGGASELSLSVARRLGAALTLDRTPSFPPGTYRVSELANELKVSPERGLPGGLGSRGDSPHADQRRRSSLLRAGGKGSSGQHRRPLGLRSLSRRPGSRSRRTSPQRSRAPGGARGALPRRHRSLSSQRSAPAHRSRGRRRLLAGPLGAASQADR